MIFTTLVSLLAVLVVANGSPLQPQQLDVITPHITSPTEAVSWAPGSCQNVTWEHPSGVQNNTGMILLGHMTETYDAQGGPSPTRTSTYLVLLPHASPSAQAGSKL
ncbi:hypothetical protein B0H13DRAFT_2311924 [Mycena leptocephala]|nr:hypothetical protein B0H13DRAFT_2311924 [Mycena leptocephala]